MLSEEPQEKRAHQRAACALQGDFISSDERAGGVDVRDISIGGIRFNAPQALERGTQMEVNIQANGTALALEGKVRWCKKIGGSWQVGFAFHRPLNFSIAEIIH